MSSNDNLAIAAHLHVLLRRKTGRVTDTEWMASDRAYAAEIVRFSRAKAIEENAPDLADLATKLEQAMANPGTPARPTLVALASQAVKQLSPNTRTAPPPQHRHHAVSALPGFTSLGVCRFPAGHRGAPAGPTAR